MWTLSVPGRRCPATSQVRAGSQSARVGSEDVDPCGAQGDRAEGNTYNTHLWVSLTDRDRRWFKSRMGVAHDAIPREKAPCAEVADTTQALVIPDLLADDHHADSDLAGTAVRFYAGVPLVTCESFGLGSLCVLGLEPRVTSDLGMTGLADLADMVRAQIEMQHAFWSHRAAGRAAKRDPGPGRPGRPWPGCAGPAPLCRAARPHAPRPARPRPARHGPLFADDMVQHAARSRRAALGRTACHVAGTQFASLSLPDPDRDAYLGLLEATLGAARRLKCPARGQPRDRGRAHCPRRDRPARRPAHEPRRGPGRACLGQRRGRSLAGQGPRPRAPLRVAERLRRGARGVRSAQARASAAGRAGIWALRRRRGPAALEPSWAGSGARRGSSSPSSSKPRWPSPPPRGPSTPRCPAIHVGVPPVRLQGSRRACSASSSPPTPRRPGCPAQ